MAIGARSRRRVPLRARADAHKARCDAGRSQRARKCIDQEDFATAIEHFTEALSKLPDDRPAEARRIRVERAKAQLLARQLPAAYDELVVLVPELQQDAATDPELLADAESALASAKYYLTWLMRLEGKTPRNGSPRSTDRASCTACWPKRPAM